MIRINLLPVEKRKAERTPVPRLFLIVATAGAAAGIFFYILYILLEINSVSNQIKEKQARLDQLRPQVAEYETLNSKKTAAQSKLNEINSVLTRDIDIGFWRAANALWDVINDHHKVWIDDLKVLDARATQGELRRYHPDSKDAPPYGVTMRCHVAGHEVEEMTRFRNALKDNPVLAQCLPTINFNPDWKVDEEKDYLEGWSISFQVALFGPTGAPRKPAAASSKPAAPPTPPGVPSPPGPPPPGLPPPPPPGGAR